MKNIKIITILILFSLVFLIPINFLYFFKYIDLVYHIILYFSLTYIINIYLKNNYIYLLLIVFGILIEIFQYYTGRNFQLIDIICNIIGIFIGYVVINRKIIKSFFIKKKISKYE